MRLANYVSTGHTKLGVLIEDSMVDLHSLLSDHDLPHTMKELINRDQPWLSLIEERLRTVVLTDLLATGTAVHLSECTFRLPIENPAQIIGIGRNYVTAGQAEQARPHVPFLFMKTVSSLVPSGASLIRPFVSDTHDWEGELAVVIGRRARHVAPQEALGYVAGYSPFNGGSIRDWQLASEQVTAGKNFWHSGAFGPYIVTTEEIVDPQALTLRTRLNGTVMQEEQTANMVFPVAELVSLISEYTVLEPGDVIATGTPGGVGARQSPQRWLDEGDEISVEIEGYATLINTVEREVEPEGANFQRWRLPPKV